MPPVARIDDFVAAHTPSGADLFADRREWKFLVPGAVAARLRRAVTDRLAPEAFVPGRPLSRVYSIYLDTPDWLLYRRALEPGRPSLKFRVRAYAGPDGQGPDGPGFLECKTGVGEGEAKRRRKQRIRLSGGRVAALWDPASPMPDPDKPRWTAAAGFARREGLRPRLTVSYLREAFVDPAGELRLTFDTDYRASAVEPEGTSSRLGGPRGLGADAVVIEVKFLGTFPDWFAEALEAEGIPAASQSFSKFKTAVALLFPEVA